MRLKSGTITSAANTQTVKGLTADAVDFLLWVFGRAYGLLRSRRCTRRSLREDERSMVAIVPPGYAWKVIDGDAGTRLGEGTARIELKRMQKDDGRVRVGCWYVKPRNPFLKRVVKSSLRWTAF